MLPVRDNDIGLEVALTTDIYSTKTYGMKIEDVPLNQLDIKGYKDDIDAMKQAIYKILLTERYKFVIYSWNYGIELQDLYGKPVPYCCVELERRTKEALLQDTRIKDVYNFDFDTSIVEQIYIKFTAKTIFGEIDIEHEVSLTNVQ